VLEYRTLSNFWLKSETFTGWVYDQVEKIFQFYNEEKMSSISPDDWLDIIDAINSSDTKKAEKLCSKFNVL